MARIRKRHLIVPSWQLFLWKWFSGGYLLGRDYTDSTFLKPARKTHDQKGDNRWCKLPGYKRSLIRNGTVVTLFGSIYAYFVYPKQFKIAAISAIVFLSLRFIIKFILTLEFKHHKYDVIEPIHRSVGPMVNVPISAKAEEWISIPRDYATNPETKVELQFPKEFNSYEAHKENLAKSIAEKLGHQEWEWNWDMVGAPTLTLIPKPKPPSLVNFEVARKFLERAKEYEPFLGLGRNKTPIHGSYFSESPHIGVSCPTGGGKTTLLRTIGSGALYNGNRVVIFDTPKRGVSHYDWANGLPGVLIIDKVELAHEYFIQLWEEMELRYEAIKGNPEEEAKLQRIVILFEEMNSQMRAITDYWKDIRTSGDRDRISPAIIGYRNLMNAGRQIKMNVVGAAQRLSAQASGGGDTRENFNTKILIGAGKKTWSMLAPETTFHASDGIPGRVYVVRRSSVRECQIALLEPSEARSWASSGINPMGRNAVMGGPTHVTDPITLQITDQITRSSDLPQTYSLPQATDFLEMTINHLRVEKSRDKNFPQPDEIVNGEGRWYQSTLQNWYYSRPSVVRKQKEEADKLQQQLGMD